MENCENQQMHRNASKGHCVTTMTLNYYRCIFLIRIYFSYLFSSIATNVWPLIVAFLYISALHTVSCEEFEIDGNEVKNAALRFGKDIAEGSAESTCLRKITANFEEHGASAQWVDANKMMDDMRNDVMNMLNWKKDAVKRIANESEKLAADYTYNKHLRDLQYINAKKIDDSNGENGDLESGWNSLKLSPHPNFENIPVNLDYSVVHVPIAVYEQSSNLINDIKWSESLTQYFRNNLAFDPGLSWQFFGSSTGFLRLYPATKWRGPLDSFTSTEEPDLYDCRMRQWYIQAAASPKDIVILLDNSGSMTGLRKEIARNVVINILDTLTDNDYFAVIKFSKIVEPTLSCYKDMLVQANKRNVKEVEASLRNMNTTDIANFTRGLSAAFDLLQKYHHSNLGSQCNQAIMLVTDGAPDNYESIFQKYNWPNIPVRVFTYLIGREVTDSKEVNWIACHNRGYYTHVSNLAEVREQVQQYIPVMSRPIVLSGERPFVWTSVYSDISDLQLTDWVWEEREKARIQRGLREQHERHTGPESPVVTKTEEEYEYENGPAKPLIKNEINTEPEFTKKTKKTPKNLQLMITLSTPVFDTRNFTNITKRILVKNIWQESEPISVRTANILGVAGIDVPIREIVKLTPAFKLGVNGYSFMITNNGYLLYHPHLRPKYHDMLRPFYSNVDISEVELADNDLGSREIDKTIDDIRSDMINRTYGWRKVNAKVHLDSMRRVVTRINNYIYGKIDHTPFSIAIVLPEPYGPYKVEGQVEVKRKEENFTHYFRGNNWRVHPDWVYCDNPHKMSGIVPKSPEDAIKQFLSIAVAGHSFRWKSSSMRPQVLDKISCDKELIQSLVFDAKATDIDGLKCDTSNLPSGKIDETRFKMYGIVTTFVATRSGLTRFEDHRSDEEKRSSEERPFYDVHTKATEEIYYRRAVDFHSINSSAFVFSVPFADPNSDKSEEKRGEILVTGSQAIVIGTGKQRAPAAVVGLQLRHSVFSERFFNITNPKIKCLEDDNIDCYLLDNNAFVIVSENDKNIGRFFGEIDDLLLKAMVIRGVYRKIRMYDYQAICIRYVNPSGPGSTLFTPLNHLKSIFTWMWTRIIMLYAQIWYNSLNAYANPDYADENEQIEETEIRINKTKAQPCDMEFDLYEMQPSPSEEQTIKGRHPHCQRNGCDQGYIVQYVPYTNLVMLVTHKSCKCESPSVKLEPKEIVYNLTDPCQYLFKTEMHRKRPKECYNHHAQEKEIKQCGGGTHVLPSVMPLMLILTHYLIYR